MSARSSALARSLAAFRSGLQCFVNSDQGRWLMAHGSQERIGPSRTNFVQMAIIDHATRGTDPSQPGDGWR